MTGKVIHLFNMREFNCSKLGAAKMQETVLVKTIDVLGYTEGVLEVRVHSGSIGTSGAKVEVILTPVAPCAEAPSQNLAVDPADATTGEINRDTAAPIRVIAALMAGFRGWLQSSVKGTIRVLEKLGMRNLGARRDAQARWVVRYAAGRGDPAAGARR